MLNQERIEQVAQEAFNLASGNRRWEMAIVRAKQQLESNPFIHLQADGTLLMLSDSDELYEVKEGFCPCRAFKNHQPCKHRAARRLMIRYQKAGH